MKLRANKLVISKFENFENIGVSEHPTCPAQGSVGLSCVFEAQKPPNTRPYRTQFTVYASCIRLIFNTALHTYLQGA